MADTSPVALSFRFQAAPAVIPPTVAHLDPPDGVSRDLAPGALVAVRVLTTNLNDQLLRVTAASFVPFDETQAQFVTAVMVPAVGGNDTLDAGTDTLQVDFKFSPSVPFGTVIGGVLTLSVEFVT